MIRIFFFLFVVIGISACDNKLTSKSVSTAYPMTPQLFTLKLGVQPNDFIQLNGLNLKKDIDKQPAGLNFYEKDWPSDDRGTVYVDHGVHSFQLVNILHATGLEDTKYPEKGIISFSLNGGGAPQSLDFHDAIRQRFLAFLEKLEVKGWEPYIF